METLYLTMLCVVSVLLMIAVMIIVVGYRRFRDAIWRLEQRLAIYETGRIKSRTIRLA